MSKFSIHAGDTPLLTGRVLETPDGPPLDLSGYTITMTGPDFTLSGTAADPTTGVYSIAMTKAATQNYRPWHYPFKVVIEAGSLQYTVVSDHFQVLV